MKKPTKKEIINYLVDVLGYNEDDAKEYDLCDIENEEVIQDIISYNRR